MTRKVTVLAGVLAFAIATEVHAGPLVLRDFFNGPLMAKGTVENLRDGTRRDFTITMLGSWTRSKGTLAEDIAYADGERDRKVWTFDKVGDGRYVGRRPDVTNDADIVEDETGIHMTYKAATKVPAGLTLNLSFDDRLTPVGPDRVAVRSDVTYLFVPAATLTLTITKAPALAPRSASPKVTRKEP